MTLPDMRAPRSLQGKLTFWHALALGVTLIGFTLAVYILLARSLSAEIDRSIHERAAQVERSVRRQLPRLRREPVTIPRRNAVSPDTFVQVSTIEGEVRGKSATLEDAVLPLSPDDLVALGEGRSFYRETELEGERVRLYSQPLTLRNRTVGVVQVARSLRPLESALDRLRSLAIAGLIVALLLSGIVVWLLTGAALRPLEHLTETADAVTASGDLAQRVPARASNDEVGRLSSTFNSMLERLQRSDSELRMASARVTEALEAQRRFVADASHELRTPLTTIRGNAALLNGFADVTTEDRAAAVAQICRESERMSRLVADLLTLARADAVQQLTRERVALTPLVEDVVRQVRALAPGPRIEVKAPQPVAVSGDTDTLRQLLLILLDNAVKHTPPEGRIYVRLDAVDEEVRLTVRDTGSGIEARDLPHIFERFYRADPGRGAGGTGLGLSIARWIAEQHGGAIEAASTPGNGATFTVRLPAGQNLSNS